MEKQSEVFGDRLAAALKASSTTQAELANQLDVSKALVSQWISGSKACPQDRVEQIATVLNADLAYLSGKFEAAPEVPEFRTDWYFRTASDGGRDYGNPNVF